MYRSLKKNLFLASNYLWFYKWRSSLIIVVLSLVILIPVLIEVILIATESNFQRRSSATPLLLGKQGSSLDLTLSSLYFTGNTPQAIPIVSLHNIENIKMARTIPLYVRFQARQKSVVGTSVDYFKFRKLNFASGKPFANLLEAVIGAKVAESTDLKLGDKIMTTSENLFDLDGVYPQNLIITGILHQNHSPDDNVIFTSMESTWVIAGIGHRHDDTAKARQIHFHGNEQQFPVSAAIVIPNDHKAKSILLGRYQKNPGGLQLIEPKMSMQALLETIFKVKKIFYSRELDTIYRMGCARSTVHTMLAAEIGIMVVMSLLLSLVLLFISKHFFSTQLLALLA